MQVKPGECLIREQNELCVLSRNTIIRRKGTFSAHLDSCGAFERTPKNNVALAALRKYS